jgi:threonyl-tRNA synthetase
MNQANQQTPKEILEAKGKLDKDIVAVRIDGKIVDLHTPVDAAKAETMKPVRTNEKDGLDVIRHSTAHVMADAVQRLFPGTKVTIGPAIEDGFYYDFDKPGGPFTEEDLATIEKTMRELVQKDLPFRREVIARADAIKLFTDLGENYKVDIIERRPPDETLTLYRHGKPDGSTGEWVDFCMGPHVPSTGYLKAIKLMSVAGAYWRGDERNPMLQRIYGTAFPSEKALEAHLKGIEEAKARDHRKLGKELDLFLFDPVSPAMPFFLPKGAYVYNALVTYIRELYEKYGYEEVITPQAFDPKLFRTSGHLGNYNENMFRLWTEDMFTPEKGAPGQPDKANLPELEAMQTESFALKPMNCPSHCVIFGSRKRSYRELPWRVADFGRLHRYERGGVVHGLSRVRSFCQDDAHIFCTDDQVPDEIEKFIKLLYEVYERFKFTDVSIKLALRPDKRVGSDEFWDKAEQALALGLQKAGLPFENLEGEGAFYGPKIEFHVKDALKRSWQLGTIQHDPNLPERFDLAYTGADGKDHRPVMLHRAVLGSLERFFSVLVEHTGGNFPTWISPRQALVITVHESVEPYGKEVLEILRAQGIRADLDDSSDKLGAKIRNGRLARYPYLCVVGAKEVEARTVGVRSREKGELGAIDLNTFVKMVKDDR